MFGFILNGIIDIIYSILNSSKIKLVIINKDAIVPYKESGGSAGYSVYCPTEITIPKGKRVLIPLGVSIPIFPTFSKSEINSVRRKNDTTASSNTLRLSNSAFSAKCAPAMTE